MRQIKTTCLLTALLTLLVACSSTEDNDTTTTLYGDAAIVGFSLGTMNCYDSEGNKTTYAGSSYPFKIDQIGRKIENTKVMDSGLEDSYWLPVGTDKAHVVCTVSTKNNGVVYLVSESDPNTETVYSATDSIDFTNPRTFRVKASNGSGYTEYTVKLNVHTKDGDTFAWEAVEEPLPSDPIVLPGIKQYLGKSTKELYALSASDKLMVSQDDGVTWVQDLADDAENIDCLPKENLALVSYPMYLSDKTDYVLLAGTGSNETRALVWRKIVDYSSGTPVGKWTYMERGDNEAYHMPVLQGLSLIQYDGVVLAFGGDYQTIYESRDNGITWKKSTRIPMPAEFDYIKVVTDSDNYIWIFCYGTNQVWKGRFNRLAWE